ncbi:MAG TPA: ATP-binding protein [Isosphaeraceae bacterium]|jgi:PAS domain S-box-containing protein|nr:ATP-binding protein [Isosphaeraceae bacterium]
MIPLNWPMVLLALLLVVVSASTLYSLRLNRSHLKLRSSLENELAERRRAEEALKASEVFYHSLVESLPQHILRKDVDGRFTFGNQRFCNGLGVAQDDLVGKTDADFYPAELAGKYRADDRRVMDARAGYETVEEHVTPHGDRLYVQVIKTPLFDPSGAVIGVQGIFWDVTARRRAEEQLKEQNVLLQEMARSERQAHEGLKQAQSRMVQSAKLAGLGQMVAGVAHEINNPLSFVGNNVAVLQRDLGEMKELIALYRTADPLLAEARPELHAQVADLCERIDIDYTLDNLRGLLDRTREGLRRIQEIVKDLRVFARLDEGEINEVDLNAGIDSSVNIIQGHARKKRVQIETELAPLPPIVCNPAKINQVITNLAVNAIDASPEGEKVTIRTAPDGADGGVLLEVADHGAGIDPAIRDRIFDPFFTTKPVGEGTGLGLSISYSIVADHGGSIEVDSEPGRGTRFLVHLPGRPPARAR